MQPQENPAREPILFRVYVDVRGHSFSIFILFQMLSRPTAMKHDKKKHIYDCMKNIVAKF